ncbi:MAG: hypothetical protein JSW50_05590 [Candidatus Latescibacterota bacterium]|nr:MAG: hypothetical protein JSW50_05590 [Candidatus Latescibacterota bacterium]
MFFGVLNTARNNKENIFYAVLTIFLLERVRTGWNKVQSRANKQNIEPPAVRRRQNELVMKAAFLYALLPLLPVVKYIYRSIEELSWSVPGLVVLKTTPAFFVILVLAECFLAIVIFNLLRIYIDRMNTAIGFFSKIGRNIWDGSKAAVQASSNVGSRVAGGLKNLSTEAMTTATGAWSRTKTTSRRSARKLLQYPRALGKLAPKRIPAIGRRNWSLCLRTPLKISRRVEGIEGSGT